MKVPPNNTFRHNVLIGLALALITLAVYWPVGSFEFNNYDDAQYITENARLHSGLTTKNVIWAFTTGYASNWHPLTWLSHMLDVQFYGLKPAGHHVTNLLFHLANTLLLFGLLLQWTGKSWRSALVAALFAWHPLHVESVAWVAERKDVLSTFFGLLTLWAYGRYVNESKVQGPRSKVFYGLALLCFALGLMAKPMLVTLPLILLLLDFWPLNRSAECGVRSAELSQRNLSQLIVEKVPFFILTALSCLVTFGVQKKGGAMVLTHLPIWQRVANAVVAYMRYMEKLAWPHDLAVLYPYNYSLPLWQVLASALVLVLASMVALRVARRRPYVMVGWFWFVITLVPVIGLVQVGEQSLADRYTYIPATGLFVLVVWGAAEMLGRQPWSRWTLGLVATLMLLACLAATSVQLRYWQNSITLFTHAIQVTQENAIAECDLGEALGAEGKTEEATLHFQRALKLRPNYPDAQNNMGSLLAGQGKLEEATAFLNGALNSRPDFDQAFYNLGLVLLKQGKIEEAIGRFRAAVRSNPRYDKALTNLGVALLGQGKLDEAVADFREAVECAPDNPYAQSGLARALDLQNKLAEAIPHYEAAVKIKPDLVEAQDNLGAILAIQGKSAEAVEHFKEALKIRPDFTEAHYNFGNALLAQGKLSEAAAQYSDAVRLQPDYMEAHINLAIVLTQLGKAREAVEHYRTALRLNPHTPLALRKLSWILATNPDPKLRDGAEAVRLATDCDAIIGANGCDIMGYSGGRLRRSGPLC